ncbi:hypothetical protein [Laspinema palackyanum]
MGRGSKFVVTTSVVSASFVVTTSVVSASFVVTTSVVARVSWRSP